MLTLRPSYLSIFNVICQQYGMRSENNRKIVTIAQMLTFKWRFPAVCVVFAKAQTGRRDKTPIKNNNLRSDHFAIIAFARIVYSSVNKLCIASSMIWSDIWRRYHE